MNATTKFISQHGVNARYAIRELIKKFELDVTDSNIQSINEKNLGFVAACLSDNSIKDLADCLETKTVGNESDWDLSLDEALSQIKMALEVLTSTVLNELKPFADRFHLHLMQR